MIVTLIVILVIAVDGLCYVWPIAGGRYLSGTFSEYRAGHYHAGIDIRTFGKVGLPCISVANARVKRIKISPYGYGKAIYLRLMDGNTAVYAHLSDFNRTCDSLAYFWRLKNRTSYCDIRLNDLELEFNAGDTVAFSGSSASSAPHLHFELRDSEERPFNPLVEYYSVPDKVPPVILDLFVYPLGNGSVVNGSPLPERYYFSAKGKNSFVLEDTLQLDGRFGFGVTVWDEQGYGRYYLAPYRVELFIDGKSIFALYNNKFSYSNARDVELEFREAPGCRRCRVTLLFKNGKITRGDRRGVGIIALDTEDGKGSGEVILSAGFHRCKIVAVDNAGNESTAQFYFKLHRYPVVTEATELMDSEDVIVSSYDPDGGPTSNRLFLVSMLDSTEVEIPLSAYGKYMRGVVPELSGGHYFKLEVTDDEDAVVEHLFSRRLSDGNRLPYCELKVDIDFGRLVLTLNFDRGVQDLPVVKRIGIGDERGSRVFRLADSRFVAIFTPEDILNSVNVFSVKGKGLDGMEFEHFFALSIAVLREGVNGYFYLGGKDTVEISGKGLRGDVIVYQREVEVHGVKSKELRNVSRPFQLIFQRDRVIGALELRFRSEKKVALYKWDDKEGWEFVGSPLTNNGLVEVASPGIYCFFKDTFPPVVKGVVEENLPEGSGFFRQRAIYIEVDDGGSGIDPYSSFVEINGEWAIAEWERYKGRFYIPVPSFLPAGEYRLRIDASDKVGNRALEEFKILIK